MVQRLYYGLLILGAVMMLNSKGYALEDKNPYTLVEGKFDKTIEVEKDAWRWVAVKPNKAFFKRPLTIECWVKLKSGGHNNFVLSAGSPACKGYWDIFVPRWGSRDLGCYLPGYMLDAHKPAVGVSARNAERTDCKE